MHARHQVQGELFLAEYFSRKQSMRASFRNIENIAIAENALIPFPAGCDTLFNLATIDLRTALWKNIGGTRVGAHDIPVGLVAVAAHLQIIFDDCAYHSLVAEKIQVIAC